MSSSSHPTVSWQTYVLVYFALLALTLLTTYLADQPLPVPEIVVAMAIASAKTALVVLIFMHLWHSSWLTWLIVAAGILFLGVMLLLTFADYMTRSPDWLPGRTLPAPMSVFLGW